MRIEKEKIMVCITCQDGSLIEGFVHALPGERLFDFINDDKEKFIVVSDAEFSIPKKISSFRLSSGKKKKKNLIILNKSSIKSIEEL